jgi:hypothetical protein
MGMNSTKSSLKPETKADPSHRVEAQPKAAESRKKVAPVLKSETKQSADPSRSVIDELARETSLKMIAKLRRAFRNAGKESTYEEQRALLEQLLIAKVPVLNRGSKRIAKVITGEVTAESLLLIHAPKKRE